MPTPIVFISYSHKDEDWKDRLLDHLDVLETEGLLQTWNDRNIGAGDEWFEEIQAAMNAARVAIFLVSAASLKSKFIRHKEIPYLLDRREKEGMTFFPVIVKSCVWDELPWLSRFQARPRDGKPLADFKGNRRDAELAKIAKEILEIVRNGAKPSTLPRPAAVAISSTLPSLHQLPAPPADFTGREEDLEVLRSALAQGGTGAIFGFRGLGGVGKTTLALKLAEELTPRYPDAQFYLDLKGVDPQPLTTAQAMAHVIRSFHPEAQLPEDGTTLAGLYRSVLFGKRTLLLMDNASKQGREQIEPLIPPAGSLLLVTSRFHFTLPGLVAQDLDEMSKEDARGLLLKMASRVGNESDEIARLCGRLPLALRLAGSFLAERLDFSPAEYARRLQEGKERLGPVEASLNLSYDLLSLEQQRLWRVLAVFPGTFNATAAAAVWELEIDLAKEALWELGRCSLVEREKEERYRLHDLARQFADQRIEPTERAIVKLRHSEYFLQVIEAANYLYEQGGEAILRGLGLFDMEWGNIQAGYAWASIQSLQEDEAARICSSYPAAGWFCLDLRQHPLERIRWFEAALAAARRREDKSQEGGHLFGLGAAYADLGEYRSAIQLYKQSLVIARKIRAFYAESNALGGLGNAYRDLGKHQLAIKFHEEGLAIDRKIGDRRGESVTLNNLGLVYSDLGEPRRALKFYEQSLAIDREHGDRYGEGRVLGNLASVYVDLGDFQGAMELYEQRLAIANEIGDRDGATEDSWNLGKKLEQQGVLALAADLMQLRVNFEREIGHRDAEKHAAYVQALRAGIAEQS